MGPTLPTYFASGFLSHVITFLRCIHTVEYIVYTILLMSSVPLYKYTTIIYSLSVDGHLELLPVFSYCE